MMDLRLTLGDKNSRINIRVAIGSRQWVSPLYLSDCILWSYEFGEALTMWLPRRLQLPPGGRHFSYACSDQFPNWITIPLAQK